MFERFRGAGTVLAGSLALLLAACGGGGGGGGSGGGGGGDGAAKSCSESFSADKAAADAGACQPTYNAQCDSLNLRVPINAGSPTACTKDGADGGVTYQDLTVGSTNYVLVTPPTGGKKGLYIALHWRSGNGATMINNMRLSELAKARDITIAAPTAPNVLLGAGGVGFVREWDFAGAADAISAVINDAKIQAKLDANVSVVVAGVSSGAAGATRFLCERGNEMSGILLVASGTISSESTAGCLSAAAASKADVGAKAAVSTPVVLVEGVDDPAYDTTVARYGQFKTINGCSAAAAANKTVALNDQVDIAYNTTCSSTDGAALVTVKDSGHNWPGMDRPIPPNPLTDALSLLGTSTAMSIFGKVSFSFDATLQGYDLVRSLD